jgi:hypothetical protein
VIEVVLVLSGEVDVVRNAAGAAPVNLARMRAGDVFGEMALVTDQPTTATVRAAVPTRFSSWHANTSNAWPKLCRRSRCTSRSWRSIEPATTLSGLAEEWCRSKESTST